MNFPFEATTNDTGKLAANFISTRSTHTIFSTMYVNMPAKKIVVPWQAES